MDKTLDTPEERRHQYGLIITLKQFREAHRAEKGLCRGCGASRRLTPQGAKGLTCEVCSKPRVFGANWFAWNGWIEELPARSWRGINIRRLLTEETNVSTPQ